MENDSALKQQSKRAFLCVLIIFIDKDSQSDKIFDVI